MCFYKIIVLDGVSNGLTVFWVVCFTSWNLLFIFVTIPQGFLIHSFHLVPNCLRCIITGQYDLWVQFRVFTFSISVCMLIPMRNGIINWYFNTENINSIMDASNKKEIIETWGSINIVLILIHIVLWIKELIRRKPISKQNAQIEQTYIINDDNDFLLQDV